MPQQPEAYQVLLFVLENSTPQLPTGLLLLLLHVLPLTLLPNHLLLAAGNQAALAARWSPGGDGMDVDHGDLAPLRVQEEQQQPSGAGSVGDRARGALVLMFLPLVLLRNQGLGARGRVLRAGRQQVEGPVERGDTRGPRGGFDDGLALHSAAVPDGRPGKQGSWVSCHRFLFLLLHLL